MLSEFSQNIQIAHCKIGIHEPVFIVAEAGVAHFGDIEKAKALVDLADSAKADAVKFQIFKTDALIAGESSDWIERMKPKELPFEAFQEIQAYCREKGIIFFATAHDEYSLDFLESLDVPAYKIGSGEVANWSFFKKVASKHKPVIFSTGMYTLNDIQKALEVFADVGNRDVAVLHCVTQYPTPPSNVNLRAMETIREKFGVIVGFSDHTKGYHFPIAAVALGARIIEKHISLDFNIPNAQDWKVSCGPADLSLMIHQVRDVEIGMGSGVKTPCRDELKNISWARKSLVAARDICEGDLITSDLIQIKRPGNGISPARKDEVIGRKAKTSIKKDKVIHWEMLV